MGACKPWAFISPFSLSLIHTHTRHTHTCSNKSTLHLKHSTAPWASCWCGSGSPRRTCSSSRATRTASPASLSPPTGRRVFGLSIHPRMHLVDVPLLPFFIHCAPLLAPPIPPIQHSIPFFLPLKSTDRRHRRGRRQGQALVLRLRLLLRHIHCARGACHWLSLPGVGTGVYTHTCLRLVSPCVCVRVCM